ncbi:LOW QUALITY PROTEIN: subtilisin-like protease SBT3.8 [Pistacia vera]|uniref:LOW QUALITY PROTEIN: subtilisin-like protease SBT3.8 n=1 Tax=Pistacia vera TaxID=55513 RepID=UPI001262D312|nr:LOW QUALITY PROTEIN: subtilisin-like protease SBT3.8 [Pistacia vera]
MSNRMEPVFALVSTVFVVIIMQSLMLTNVEAKSNVHIVYLGERQHDDPKVVTDSHHELLATIIGSKEEASKSMVYNYKHGFSGFAAKLTESQAQRLSEFPGVVRVIPNSIFKVQTTRSWDFLGLSSRSPSNLLHNSSMGEGAIIGVFDTGIWPESKAFCDEGLGPIPSHWKGTCESGDQFNATTHCNRKIIGARWFVDGYLAENGQLNTTDNEEYYSPRDANGHGSHTSSTAAGSFVPNVSYKGLGYGTVRGGAPRARLAMYKVCWQGGQCASADILKAFDEAIYDGVDVISISIASGMPGFAEVDERNGIATGSFHAVAKGITVVCAASNDGPVAQTVQNTAPWIVTVAASSTDRAFFTHITLGNNRTILGRSIFTGKETAFTEIVYPETTGLNPTSAAEIKDASFNATMVAGKVVLLYVSTIPRYTGTKNPIVVLQESGAVGVIIVRTQFDISISCYKDLACAIVDLEVGNQILMYIRSTRSPVVKLSPSKTFVGKPLSAKVAIFSSRGPSSISPAILKPDIAAPGVNILAAVAPHDQFNDNGFNVLSGTSMATPHVAGIVALLKASHHDWSPAAIKSALVTTAWKNSPSGSPTFAEGLPHNIANPFDIGGGIVNPNEAADPGLVYDMSTADYMLYLCATGYNNSAISWLAGQATICPSIKPSILDVNVPSITIPNLRDSVTLTRTVTNVGASQIAYTAVIEPPFGIKVSVTPQVLHFKPTAKKISYQVTVFTSHKVNTGFYFGSLTWTDGVHAVRIPLSVRTQILAPSHE